MIFICRGLPELKLLMYVVVNSMGWPKYRSRGLSRYHKVFRNMDLHKSQFNWAWVGSINGTNSFCVRFKYFIPWTGLLPILLFLILICHVQNTQRAGARDDRGNPIIRDFYSSPLTARYATLNLYAYIGWWLHCCYTVYIYNLVIVSAVMPMTKCCLPNLRVYILVLVALALRWLVF